MCLRYRLAAEQLELPHGPAGAGGTGGELWPLTPGQSDFFQHGGPGRGGLCPAGTDQAGRRPGGAAGTTGGLP